MAMCRGEISTIDNHSRVLFDSCPAKYDWRINQGLVPVELKSMAPLFGLAIHVGLYCYRKGGSWEDVQKAFLSEYAKYYDEKDDERTPLVGVALLRDYVRRYPREEDYLQISTLDYLEVGFSICITEDIVYEGRIDWISKWNDELIIVDYKTAKYPNSSYVVEKPNNQLSGYILAAREITGLPIKTAILDVLGTHMKKQKIENGRRKLLTEEDERFDLIRKPTERSVDELGRFKRDLIMTTEFISACQRKDEWKMNTDSCADFQGCEYQALCNSNKEALPYIIDQFYKREEWRAYEAD